MQVSAEKIGRAARAAAAAKSKAVERCRHVVKVLGSIVRAAWGFSRGVLRAANRKRLLAGGKRTTTIGLGARERDVQ